MLWEVSGRGSIPSAQAGTDTSVGDTWWGHYGAERGDSQLS